jgi:hypothetical protein
VIIAFETSNGPYCKFLFFEKVILQLLITDGPYRGIIDQVTMNKRVVKGQKGANKGQKGANKGQKWANKGQKGK